MRRILFSISAFLLMAHAAYADHAASADEKVVYKGELVEGQSVSGSVSDRVRREWYTFNVQANMPVTFSAAATTTGLPVNIGVLKGQVAKGKSVEELELQGGFLGLTNNGSAPTITLTITPNFSGPVSVYIARFFGESGDYTATVSVSKLPVFTSLTSDKAGALSNYSFAVLVAGEQPITLTSDPLPAGLTLNGTLLQGIPTVTGFFNITFSATNSFGTTTQLFSLQIDGPVIRVTALDPDNTPVPTTTVFSDTQLTLMAQVAQGAPTFTWNFGDSTTATGNPVTKAYTVATGEQTFFVSLSTNDGVNTFTSSQSITVSAPLTTAANTSQGISVRNPDAGVAVSVQKSMGGVVGLAINPESAAAQTRALDDFETSTAYNGLFGSPARAAISGARPVAKFTSPTVVVAETTVIPTRTKTPTSKTRKSRKTLIISESELGLAPSGLVDNRSSKALTPQTLKGKFGLGGSTKEDSVSFKGTFLLPMGVTPGQSQQVSIAIGNVIDTVTIDEKGKGQLPSSAGLIKKLSIKLPKLKDSPVTVGNEVATLDFTYQAQALVTKGFDTEGISADGTDLDAKKRTAPRKIQVLLKFAGVGYEIPADVTLKVAPKNDAANVILTRSSKALTR